MTREEYKEEWVRLHTCTFCPGSQRHTCTSFQCQPAYEKAEEYFENVMAKEEAAIQRRKICSSATNKAVQQDKVSS